MAFTIPVGGGNLPKVGVEIATEKEEPSPIRLAASPLDGTFTGGSSTEDTDVPLVNSLVEKDNSKLLEGTDVYMAEVLWARLGGSQFFGGGT